ncbi:MAG: hypothetical protein WEB78_03005, partial [Ilumatobacteraceae bacterium]
MMIALVFVVGPPPALDGPVAYAQPTALIEGALGPLTYPALSPNGTWRAALEKDHHVTAVFRSNGATQWSRIELPEYCYQCSSWYGYNPEPFLAAVVAVDDAGVVMVARLGQLFSYVAGGWTITEITSGDIWWAAPVGIVATRGMTIIALSDGTLTWSTDGESWEVDQGNPAGPGYQPGLTVVGDVVFVPAGDGLRRWSPVSKSWLPASGGPTGGVSIGSVAGSTSTLWAAVDLGQPLKNSWRLPQSDFRTWSLWSSVDGGASWAVSVSERPMPSRYGVFWETPRWLGDNRWHLYGTAQSTDETSQVSYEVTFDPATGGWGVPTRSEGFLVGSVFLFFPTQLPDGSLTAALRLGATLSASGTYSYSAVGAGVADPIVTTTQQSTPPDALRSTLQITAPSTSPSGRWTVMTEWVWNSEEIAVWRTSGDGAWERIPMPERIRRDPNARPGPSQARPPVVAVRNDGTVLLIATEFPSHELVLYRFGGVDWYGPTRTFSSGDMQAVELVVDSSGRMAFVMPDSDIAVSNDDGR